MRMNLAAKQAAMFDRNMDKYRRSGTLADYFREHVEFNAELIARDRRLRLERLRRKVCSAGTREELSLIEVQRANQPPLFPDFIQAVS